MIPDPPSVIRFGSFEIDIRAGELRRDSVRVPLQEKPFQLLEMLVRHAGEIVSRDELARRLWPDGTYVDFDAGLNTAVRKVRAALGDSAETPIFVETVGRRGYRFIAAISSSIEERERPVTPAMKRPARLLLAAAALAAIAVAVLLTLPPAKPASPAKVRSIAILPIRNATGNPADDYIAAGLRDQLIARLERIPSLKVISRESSARFSAGAAAMPQMRDALHVDVVVTGAVSLAGKRLRTQVSVIDLRSDSPVWKQTWESRGDESFALQEMISRDLFRYLGLTEPARPASFSAPSNRAYLLYLRGRYEWCRVPPAYASAMQYFQSAIDEDPGFAPAYVGLADCYATRFNWIRTTTRPSDDRAQARALATKALQLDPSLGEAYATLGSIADDEYDFATADAAFPKAVALDPSLSYAHEWFALHLTRLGRFDQALSEARLAESLDPQSWFSITILAMVLTYAGRNVEAMEVLDTRARLYPKIQASLFQLVVSHRLANDDAAMSALRRLLDSCGVDRRGVDASYTRGGFAGALKTALGELEARSASGRGATLGHWDMATLYAVRGDAEGTIRELQRSYAEQETSFGYVNVAPETTFVRDDPRIAVLARKIGLRH